MIGTPDLKQDDGTAVDFKVYGPGDGLISAVNMSKHLDAIYANLMHAMAVACAIPIQYLDPGLDGMSIQECYRIFVETQQDGSSPATRLNNRQLEVARMEWSRQLKLLNKAAKGKERHKVVIERDSYDE